MYLIAKLRCAMSLSPFILRNCYRAGIRPPGGDTVVCKYRRSGTRVSGCRRAAVDLPAELEAWRKDATVFRVRDEKLVRRNDADCRHQCVAQEVVEEADVAGTRLTVDLATDQVQLASGFGMVACWRSCEGSMILQQVDAHGQQPQEQRRQEDAAPIPDLPRPRGVKHDPETYASGMPLSIIRGSESHSILLHSELTIEESKNPRIQECIGVKAIP